MLGFAQGKAYMFMMRTKQPAGVVSNQLYLTMDDLANEVRGFAGGFTGCAYPCSTHKLQEACMFCWDSARKGEAGLV